VPITNIIEALSTLKTPYMKYGRWGGGMNYNNLDGGMNYNNLDGGMNYNNSVEDVYVNPALT
jgi:hypothetical protein